MFKDIYYLLFKDHTTRFFLMFANSILVPLFITAYYNQKKYGISLQCILWGRGLQSLVCKHKIQSKDIAQFDGEHPSSYIDSYWDFLPQEINRIHTDNVSNNFIDALCQASCSGNWRSIQLKVCIRSQTSDGLLLYSTTSLELYV